ncbi:tetratricopeptide repeat protein [Phnomibacter sp. MR]|uniref:tetratricopeptide repeat protein n=1 Tax=Phnomibacter sp. MR TaxID=3042318 RepID=UPI003A80E271
MKFYNLILRYRFWLGLVALALAIAVNVWTGFWPSFILYLLAVVAIASHFFIGPMRLIQEYIEAGDMEGAEKVLGMIWFPNLLYKPIRSAYYTLKGQMAMMRQDFKGAEEHMKRSEQLGMPMAEAEGANKLQLGMLAMQRGDLKQGENYIRAALRAGIPDADGAAMAYLQMCQIYMNKGDMRSLRAAKDMYRKAKEQKPTNKDVVEQIKKLNSYISRIPG